MGFVEKIVLTMIVYVLMFIFAFAAILAYLMMNEICSMIMVLIIMALFYTLALIEEQ